MKITTQSYTSVALSATGFAAAVAYAAGGYALSVTTPNDGMAHTVTFLNKTANDHSGKTVTFTGTDEDGKVLTVSQAGPAGSVAITTTPGFKTLTSVTISSTTSADTFDIGWTATAFGANIYPDYSAAVQGMNMGIAGEVSTAGSINNTWGIQYTYDKAVWTDDANIAGKSARYDNVVTKPVAALRLKVTAAGSINMFYREPYAMARN